MRKRCLSTVGSRLSRSDLTVVAVESLERRRMLIGAYALLGTGGTLLAEFETDHPEILLSVKQIQGLRPGEQLRGLDFRQSDETLFAVGIGANADANEAFLLTIDPQSGN